MTVTAGVPSTLMSTAVDRKSVIELGSSPGCIVVTVFTQGRKASSNVIGICHTVVLA
jgi:hypothetical protein